MKLKKTLKKILPGFVVNIVQIIRKIVYSFFDIILLPLTIIAAFWLKDGRKSRFKYMPVTKKFLFKIGVYPIIDHYYEPMFNPKHLRKSLRDDRDLAGINFNIKKQLDLLNEFDYNQELLSFPRKKTDNVLEFSYDYGAYPSGDSEIWYSIIRYFKPNKIIEIGCGSSTLMALNAIRQNKDDDSDYYCNYTCVEPYEQPWLERTEVKVLREKVEELPLNVFKELNEKDILFIDSSHIIRPQGDVLFEILEILPVLKSGVLVHFHDIATPKDYFDEWVCNYFWNEQYLLEAFLSYNSSYEILLSSNYLFHHYNEKLMAHCPILKLDKEENPKRELGSFWIRRK